MWCEGPNWYDPATEISTRIGTELPEDFHCESENKAWVDDNRITEYQEINDITPEEEDLLYRESSWREEERIREEELRIAEEGLDKM